MPKTSPLGKFLRHIRLEKEEKQADMAKRLHMSKSYLSMIEMGRRSVPEFFVDVFVATYRIDADQEYELRRAIAETRSWFSVILHGHEKDDSDLLFDFYEKFKTMSDDQKKAIKGVLDSITAYEVRKAQPENYLLADEN